MTSPTTRLRRSAALSLLAAPALLAALALATPALPAQAARLSSGTTLTADRDVIAEGDTVVLTATVTSQDGPPTGSVTFSGTKGIGCAPVPLVAGTATCSLTLDWPVSLGGSLSFEVHYSGDAAHQKSLGKLTIAFRLAAEPLRLKDYAGHVVVAGKPFTVRNLRALTRRTRPTPRRLLFVAATGTSGSAQSVTGIGSIPAGLPRAWKRVGAGSGSTGAVEVWQTTQDPAPGRPVATLAVPGAGGLIAHAAFVGADPAGARVVGRAEGTQGEPTLTFTPDTDGGQVWVVGVDACSFDSSTRTPVAGATLRDLAVAGVDGPVSWVESVDAPTRAGTPVTVGLAGRSCGDWQLLAVEVDPATAG